MCPDCRRVSAMVWWEDTVDPTRFPFQYPVKKQQHCISFIYVNFKFSLVFNISFAFNLLFIPPLKFLPLIYLSFWPCFFSLVFLKSVPRGALLCPTRAVATYHGGHSGRITIIIIIIVIIIELLVFAIIIFTAFCLVRKF